MWNKLFSFFGFVFALVVVAAVTTLTAQTEPTIGERLHKVESDIEFIILKVNEVDASCLKKEEQ
jgi:hypothetical protein